MSGPASVAVFALLVLVFAAFAKRLTRAYISAPIAFVVVGGLIALVTVGPDIEQVLGIKVVAELTLALILFHDAAQVRPRQIGNERGLVMRLLLVGLPLTILVGYFGALVLFPGISLMLALFLASALSATDAGLGAATVLNPVVPVRVRRILNVESGLNDGLATPVVLFAIAAVAGEEHLRPTATALEALGELAIGTIVGVVVGVAGGLMLGNSRIHGWSGGHDRTIGVLVMPLLAYTGSEAIGGNAFVAAFVAGTAFAGAAKWLDAEPEVLGLTEAISEPLGYAVWLVFGLVALPFVWNEVGWRECVFAVLALTVFRMLPVACVLIGTHLRLRTILFVGWFGPRGLASVVFALIAVESLRDNTELRSALAALVLTVLLSVVAHGLSADPLAARYGAWVERIKPDAETRDAAEPSPRIRSARRHVRT